MESFHPYFLQNGRIVPQEPQSCAIDQARRPPLFLTIIILLHLFKILLMSKWNKEIMNIKKRYVSFLILNFSLFLFLSFHISLAIDITGCTQLDQEYGIYNLTQDIIDSSASTCLDITANNVILDCGGHKIDGKDIYNSYGIKIYRSSQQATNITIKNCVVTDWFDGIYLENSNENELKNITSNSNYRGLYFYFSYYNTLANITANSNSWYGINLDSSHYNVLTNITTNSNSNNGIFIYHSNSITLTNITTNSNGWYGVFLKFSDSNTLTNITTQNNNRWDIYYTTTHFQNDCHSSFQNVIGTGNKPILFFNTTTTIKNWNNNVSEIILCHADNSIIDNLTLIGSGNNGLIITATYYTNITNSYFENLYDGIYLDSSNSNALTNITTNSNIDNGIYLSYSDSNNFTNITSNSNTWNGIYFYYSDSNNFTNITSNSNNNGILLYHSNSNNFTNITANSNNYRGIYLSYSDSNTLANSHISNNTQYGLYLYNAGSSTPNLIYNNFFNNTNNIYFSGTIYPNNWNTTKQEGMNIVGKEYIGGNFYAKPDGTGYSETCEDSDFDGFCDSPYTLATDNIDYLPLTNKNLYITFKAVFPKDLTIENSTDHHSCLKNDSYRISIIGKNPISFWNQSDEKTIVNISEPLNDELYFVTTIVGCSRIQYYLDKILSGTFLQPLISFGYPIPTQLYITLKKSYIDIVNSLHLSKGTYTLKIRNLGKSGDKTKIEIKLIS